MFVTLKYMINKTQDIEWTQEWLFLMSEDIRSFKIQKSKGRNKNQEKAELGGRNKFYRMRSWVL